jgi:TolA-binding protein
MSHDLVRTAMTIDDSLDDIKRARIWTRIADEIDAPIRARSRWPLVACVATCAAAIVAFIALRRPAEPKVLSASADTTLTSQIGPHTKAALVGDTQVEIIGTPADATALHLRRGTLLAEFDGAAGRSLRISAPRMDIEIVGTLFALEVHDTRTCLAVAHGKVRVTIATRAIDVTGGQQLCSDEPTPHAIPSAIRDALTRHASVLASADERRTTPPSPATNTATPSETSHAIDTPRAIDTPKTTDAPPARATDTQHATDTPHATDATHSTDAPRSNDPTVPPPPPTPRVADARARLPNSSTTPRVATPPRANSSPQPTTIDSSVATAPRDVVAPRATDASKSPAPAAGSPPRSNGSSSGAPTTNSSGPLRSADAPTPSPHVDDAPKPLPVPPTSDQLYAAAEASLAARDPVTADRTLERLLAEHPTSPLVDQALYERARIAYQRRAWATARRHLDRLAAIPTSSLAEPGRYLACRIAVQARDGEAEKCLVDYRASYPRSPHDLDVLALLVQLAHGSGGCKAAAPVLDELARSYPKAPAVSAWRTRCPR